jgi:hypothetical protein
MRRGQLRRLRECPNSTFGFNHSQTPEVARRGRRRGSCLGTANSHWLPFAMRGRLPNPAIYRGTARSSACPRTFTVQGLDQVSLVPYIASRKQKRASR